MTVSPAVIRNSAEKKAPKASMPSNPEKKVSSVGVCRKTMASAAMIKISVSQANWAGRSRGRSKAPQSSTIDAAIVMISSGAKAQRSAAPMGMLSSMS